MRLCDEATRNMVGRRGANRSHTTSLPRGTRLADPNRTPSPPLVTPYGCLPNSPALINRGVASKSNSTSSDFGF